uniref:TPR repeat-containing protein n=1 Tax=Solibacter usitatus (strain Ellin6076) TaxID=234267 RepID=Q027T4_SOLUE
MDGRKNKVSAQAKSYTSGVLFSWHVVWLVLAALIVGASLYSSALHGRFIFDDDALPFQQGIRSASLRVWLAGVRPFLMFSYWLNYRISGSDPYSYHVFNLLIHAVNTGLVFVVLLRLLGLAEWDSAKRHSAAVLGATVFLIHPLATESVSYVAGRSESLAALFLLLAYAVFLDGYNSPISWGRSAVVMTLFGIAAATKENAVALAGLLLLTDLSWPRPYSIEGLRRNYKVYLLMTPGVALAAVWVGRVLSTAETAGFSLKEVTWYQYGFTQARAVFEYLRLAFFPVGQSVDHDFPVSHAVTEYGAIFYLVLLAALITAAILVRHRYPLATFGFLMFLILLAPTSSVIPIADPLVERRMYVPIVGLILVACQAVKGLRWSNGAVAVLLAILALFGGLCYQRNHLWGKPEQVWARAAEDSTRKGRPFLGLAESLIAENRCAEAIPFLERGEQLMPHDFAIEVAWGKVLECQGKLEDALQRLERAAAILPNSFVYQLIGLLYGEMGKKEEAGAALRKAEQLGPGNVSAHCALGLWYESMDDAAAAEREYREALSIDAYSTEAQMGLDRIHVSTAARE